jgi:hypothetical protein
MQSPTLLNDGKYIYQLAACSLGLSATSQQYFSLRTNQPPATSQQYSSLRTNQQQPSATSQPNRLLGYSINGKDISLTGCVRISGLPNSESNITRYSLCPYLQLEKTSESIQCCLQSGCQFFPPKIFHHTSH